jgi:hypothetical protein
MSIHQNSLRCYGEERDNLGKRASLIYNLLREKGALTDRDVMTMLGFKEPNATRPRLTELIKASWCYEVGDIDCIVTGKRVRLVAARTAQEREAHLKVLRVGFGQLELFHVAA